MCVLTTDIHSAVHSYLEECESCVELKDDASYAPHVTRLRPAQLCNTPQGNIQNKTHASCNVLYKQTLGCIPNTSTYQQQQLRFRQIHCVELWD